MGCSTINTDEMSILLEASSLWIANQSLPSSVSSGAMRLKSSSMNDARTSLDAVAADRELVTAGALAHVSRERRLRPVKHWIIVGRASGEIFQQFFKSERRSSGIVSESIGAGNMSLGRAGASKRRARVRMILASEVMSAYGSRSVRICVCVWVVGSVKVGGAVEWGTGRGQRSICD